MARDLEAQYFEEMERHLNTDSPQQPTQEPPADAVKPHVLKLESSIPGTVYYHLRYCVPPPQGSGTADSVL